MKVDVILPTFNRSKILENVVNNLLKQTYPINILIVDNCSTDNTEKVALNLANKYENVKYYKNDVNLQIYGSYNISLLKYSSADYCLFISDDDFFTDFEYISKAVDYIDKYNLDFVAAGYYIVNINSLKMKSISRKESFIGNFIDFFNQHKFGYDNFAWFNVLFNRKKITKFLFDNTLYNSDFCSLFCMALNGRCAVLKDRVGVYTLHNSQSNRDNSAFMFNGIHMYYKIKSIDLNDIYKNEIFVNHITAYISGIFKFLMDRDCEGKLNFDYKYWFEYFKEFDNGKFFPFLSENDEKLFSIFVSDKYKYAKIRNDDFKKRWKDINDKFIFEYIKNLKEGLNEK